MQVGKRLTALVVVEQVLQIKPLQFLQLILMPEHHLRNSDNLDRVGFAPPHGNLTNVIFDFEISYLEHNTLVFQRFTVSPLFLAQ